MSDHRIPLINKAYFKFEFPTYDSLSSEDKDRIEVLFANINDVYSDFCVNLDEYWNVEIYTDETTGISVPFQYLQFWNNDLEINFFNEDGDLDVEKMTQPVFKTSLLEWFEDEEENWNSIELCPVDIKFYVDDVLTPIANYRVTKGINSYYGYANVHGHTFLVMKESGNDDEEFPKIIHWSFLKEIASKGHLVLFNVPTNYNDELSNKILLGLLYDNKTNDDQIVYRDFDFIEAVYVSADTTSKYVRLENFTVELDVYDVEFTVYDEEGNAIDVPYYVILNPDNLSLGMDRLRLVTGKLSFDTSRTHDGSGGDPFRYFNFYHFAVDNCGLHVFNDLSGEEPDYTILKSFPEHQINDIIDALDGNFNYDEGFETYKYLNFGSELIYYNRADSMYGFGCLIDGVEYKIIGIKSISSNYDGYVSESYFEEDFSLGGDTEEEAEANWEKFTHIVSYDNHGYGDTSETTVTAWVVNLYK